MTEYTALMALPDGDMAREAAARVPGSTVIDNEGAGVWVTWTCESETDEGGIRDIQEMRLRAEMTPGEESFTLFQATPFLIMRGRTTVIHSEEVICI